MEISGIRTLNFPYEVIDGQEHYSVHASVVVEDIAERIPPEVKPAITVDYEKIPESFHQIVKKKMGIEEVNEQEAREREQRLVDFLEKEGVFSSN